MIFYLGTHEPSWLADRRFAKVPLFVSRSRLCDRRTLPRAVGPWGLDSGAFQQLQLHGRWTLSRVAYVDEVRRYQDEIGKLVWAAPMDWTCGPEVIARTRLSPMAHVRRTVDNFLRLRALAPELPFIPVLQGWEVRHYLKCADLYYRAGIDLQAAPVVGVGSMVGRETSPVAQELLQVLADEGFAVHGFGFKMRGLRAHADKLISADSTAWSYRARREPPIAGHDRPGPGRPKGHQHCNNCPEFALRWLARKSWS